MPTISTKYTVTGDKAYRDALKEINSGLSVLRSEMKKATAEYELNEDAVGGLAAQNDVLDRTLLTLSDKLGVQEQQWARLVDQYGEADLRVQRLAREINETNTEMYRAEKAIKDNEDAMEDYADEAKKAGESSGTLGGVIGDLADKFGVDLPGGLDNALGALGDMDAGAAGLVGVLAGLGTQIANLVADTAEWAKELQKQADVTGLSTDSLQQLEYLAISTGAEYDQLVDGTKDLTERMKEAAEGNEEYSAAFEKLGVAVVDSNGQLRDMDDVYWDVIAGLQAMGEGTERDALAMSLMGESARELNPLLNLTAEEMDALRDSAQVMSEDTIDNINEMRVNVETELYKLRKSFSSAIGEIADWLSGDLSAGDMKLSLAVQSGNVGRNAHGTDYWPGGLTWVGEEGPELVNLPAGSSVTPAGQAGGDTFNFNINASNIKELNDLVRIAGNARMSQRMGYTGR